METLRTAKMIEEMNKTLRNSPPKKYLGRDVLYISSLILKKKERRQFLSLKSVSELRKYEQLLLELYSPRYPT